MNERVNPSVARPVMSQRAGSPCAGGVNLGAEVSGVDLASRCPTRNLRRSRPRWSKTS